MDGTPNFFSWTALILFAPITLICFARMQPVVATTWTMLGAVMFLPEVIVFDPPLLPPMDKLSIAAFWIFIGCLWKARQRVVRARPMRGIDLFFVLVLVGNFGTALTNPDQIVTGPVVRQGLVVYDAFAGSIKDSLFVLLPFLIGRAMFRTPAELREFMRILVVAGLVYTLFALFEIRMSPQSHRMLYGYHPASFEMTIRGGGYRPTIFMITGLGVAMFFLSAVIAAMVRWKAGLMKWYVPTYLTGVLVLCKSTGAIVYAAVLVPLLAIVRKPRFVLPLALAGLVFTFPLLRGADLFPTRELTDFFMGISEDRALSLWFRFDNEDQLLDRGRERMMFGWGGYSRQRIFDPESGEDMSVTDGHWIIVLGERGLVGYVGLFGLLLWPIVQAYRMRKKIRDPADRHMVAGLALIVAINAVDLLPNGLFSYLPYFYSGILAGVLPAFLASRAAPRVRGPAARREQRRGVPVTA
ncbi:MAG: hypothetical protein M3Y87_06330 [Myxococcota bacterium]|nr:hypothetical protein [Myxococcota bacterium]